MSSVCMGVHVCLADESVMKELLADVMRGKTAKKMKGWNQRISRRN